MSHNRIASYFIESYQELTKVIWPTRNKAVNICILVIGFVIVASAFIAGVDFIFNKGYSYLLSIAPQ